jgi:hypothetical protein
MCFRVEADGDDFFVGKDMIKGSGGTFNSRHDHAWRLPLAVAEQLLPQLAREGFLVSRAKPRNA